MSKVHINAADSNVTLIKSESENDLNYKEVVRSLMYAATLTQRDISFSVGEASRFLNNPDINAAKRIIKYLKDRSKLDIRFNAENEKLLEYTDSDFAKDTRKSITGFIFF